MNVGESAAKFRLEMVDLNWSFCGRCNSANQRWWCEGDVHLLSRWEGKTISWHLQKTTIINFFPMNIFGTDSWYDQVSDTISTKIFFNMCGFCATILSDPLSILTHVTTGLNALQKMFKASCLAIILYGCESWIITRAISKGLNGLTASCCDEIQAQGDWV